MVHPPGCRPLFVCLAAGSIFLLAGGALAQISFPGQYPGQYPGGQYPGQGRYPQGGSSNPFPGRGRNTTNNQVPLITINGILRQISSSDMTMVVEADDKRIVTIALANSSKYYKASGGSGRTSDFQPGDHVNIDATQDDNGYYHAKNVTQVKAGTPEERAAASQPVDPSPIAGGGNADGDDDRPRLRRNSSPSGAGDAQNAPITPQITRGDSNDSQTVSRVPAPPVPPAPPAPPDPNDPGPPVLRRGIPQRSSASSNPKSSNSDPPLVARNDPSSASRPNIHADEVNGVTRTPDAPPIDANRGASSRGIESQPFPASGDPVIDKAREAAFSFSDTLPNYVVKQFTTRYQTEAARGGQTSWRALDTVSADVVYEGGKESYRNILINGKPPKEAVEKTGSWSTGEYSSVLLDVLSPGTDADFHNKRSTTIVNRAAYRYDFSVDQPNSHWHVYASAESYVPEYTGVIWIDKENSRVLRIEMAARNMPRAFPLDTVESAVDYDYVLIGDGKFLLPVHSEALSCERGTSLCSRNTIDFRNYKKFSADTSITFDPGPDK